MPEPAQSRNLVMVAVLALLVPAVLGLGWLLGRVEGPSPRAVAGEATPDLRSALARVHPARFSVSYEHGAAPAAPLPGSKREEPSAWTTYDAAVAESRDSGKPVLVDFNAEWCPPCQALKRTVFDDAERGRAVQLAVIPVSIVDRTREEGGNRADVQDLQQKYDVEAFPTLVVFSPATGRKESHRGFGDPDDMLRWIEGAAQAVK